MADVITIDTDCQEEYERKVRSFLEYGYELKSCSCGYYGIASSLLNGDFSKRITDELSVSCEAKI